MEGRKRYNVGRYIQKKYGRRKAYSKLNPFRSMVQRRTKTNQQAIKCTSTHSIKLNDAGDYFFSPGGNNYLNLATMLSTSQEFTSRILQYSYYMINGMNVKYARRWIDPISYGVNGTSPGFLANSFHNGLAMLSSNFYPNLASTFVGSPVERADSSWEVSPYTWTTQSHYQPFPKNFSTGPNSNGLGVWNACSQYASISGELAIYNDGADTVKAADVDHISIFDVEINLYITFCNNTGI